MSYNRREILSLVLLWLKPSWESSINRMIATYLVENFGILKSEIIKIEVPYFEIRWSV